MNGSMYLYSDQLIEENSVIDEHLANQIGKSNAQIAYIASEPDPERQYFNRKRQYYSKLGVSLAQYIDEENCNSNIDTLNKSNFDAIHLSGGNTFDFLYWLRNYNMLPVLKQYVQSGGILVGNSAGSIVTTPSIETALLCGDKNRINLTDLQSLDLVDFLLWPHYRSESSLADAEKIVDRKQKRIMCVPDGCGVIVNDGHVETVGEVITIEV